jgi:hypothetical protein
VSDSELKCDSCQKPAKRLLVRADLGDADERMLVCENAACKPPEGEWHSYPIDTPALGKEYEEKNP